MSSSIEKLKLLFNEDSPYKLRAGIDMTIIEAYILAQSVKEMHEIYNLPNFAEIFSHIIVHEFMGKTTLEEASPKPKDGEKPVYFQLEKKFIVVEEYFTNKIFKLPPLFKRLGIESERDHEERVLRMLIVCDDNTFTQIQYIIDPDNHLQEGFIATYNKATAERIGLKKSGRYINEATDNEEDPCNSF